MKEIISGYALQGMSVEAPELVNGPHITPHMLLSLSTEGVWSNKSVYQIVEAFVSSS